MKLTTIVATNLRRLRNAKGLSQEVLAEMAKLNRNYVGMIERERNSPTVEVLEQLASALDVEPQEFFRKPGERPTSVD
jgi:transcriptional regulator with XRE-family HTH domain